MNTLGLCAAIKEIPGVLDVRLEIQSTPKSSVLRICVYLDEKRVDYRFEWAHPGEQIHIGQIAFEKVQTKVLEIVNEKLSRIEVVKC